MRKLITIACVSVITIGFVALNQRSAVVFDISARADTKESRKHLSLFGEIFDKVRADYVDKVDERQLMENAVNGMTAWLGAQPIHLAAKSSKKPSIYLAEFADIYDKLRADYAGKVDERLPTTSATRLEPAQEWEVDNCCGAGALAEGETMVGVGVTTGAFAGRTSSSHSFTSWFRGSIAKAASKSARACIGSPFPKCAEARKK